jgi:hypothetical protein
MIGFRPHGQRHDSDRCPKKPRLVEYEYLAKRSSRFIRLRVESDDLIFVLMALLFTLGLMLGVVIK